MLSYLNVSCGVLQCAIRGRCNIQKTCKILFRAEKMFQALAVFLAVLASGVFMAETNYCSLLLACLSHQKIATSRAVLMP